MRLYGQTFTASTLARIREAVASEQDLTRSALSRKVCDWLSWHGPQGKPQEVSARKALGELAQRGLIELPAPRCAPPQLRGDPSPELWPAMGFTGPLEALGKIELVAVEGAASVSIWNRMLSTYHPLGPGPLCGAQRRYLIHSERGWLGGLAFSAAAWHLASRDEWIGWCAHARRANLQRVVANSRFLLLPTVEAPNLGSHVLALAARRVAKDWPRLYGYAPVLLETFVDESRFLGTVYKAANWQRLGETRGRGRQDQGAGETKAVYVLPLQKDWRNLLCQRPKPVLRRPESMAEGSSWAQREFGGVDFPDGRLRPRLISLAEAFFQQPLANIPDALHGDASQIKAAYRFFKNPQVDLQTLLHPHYEQTVGRVAQQPVVLAVQDTTSLNYDDHPATRGLGPINTRADGAQRLKLHDTMAFTPEGTPLGLIDIQIWARDPQQMGKAAQRKQRPIEEKESLRWLNSFRRTAEVQRLCPETHLINVADREADLYELFQDATADPKGPDLLIRASRTTQRSVTTDDDELEPLWAHLPGLPVAGGFTLKIPSRGKRKARTAELEIRFAPVQLRPPKRLKGVPAIGLWAVHAVEPQPPEDHEPVEWLLLTTVATPNLDTAFERLQWYAARWNIEVYHRVLKSGCRIEDRRLGDADRLEASIALDLVTGWRIFYLTKLGREAPELPADVFFEEAEWQALYCYLDKTQNPPEDTPPLGEAMRRLAKLGGFIGRKGDGEPGPTVLWRGLDKLHYITEAFRIFHPALPAGP
jgi:hypothetical protein